MRLLILTTLLVSTALGGCVADATSKGGTDVAKQVDSNKQPEKIESPWKLGIESKRDAGPKIQSAGEDSKTLEAAGKWFVVMLSVENTSADRQSAKEVFMLNVAEMTDTTGKVYSVDTDASETYDTSLDKKPFAPGEARSIKMVFDIGKTAKPKQVEVRGTDMKQDMQTFIAKF